MIDIDLLPASPLAAADAAPDILGAFLGALGADPEAHVVFLRPDGEAIRDGYHVTEVMSTDIRSIDCGGRPEAWTETVIQLLDEQDATAREMRADRFLGIVARVDAAVDLDRDARVVIEWGTPGEAARRYVPVGIEVAGGIATVALAPLAATCKPRALSACC